LEKKTKDINSVGLKEKSGTPEKGQKLSPQEPKGKKGDKKKPSGKEGGRKDGRRRPRKPSCPVRGKNEG